MARHPNAPRVQKKDEPDDVFVARLLQLTAWAKANTRLLVTAAAILVLIVLGGLHYRNVQHAQFVESELRLVEIRQTAMTGNRALVIQDIETLLVTYGSTRAADEARVLLARLYLEEGRPEDAIDAVRELSSQPGRPLGAPAAFLLAAAYEAMGDFETAESTYLRIADRADLPYQRREALDFAARIRLDQGDVDRAVELYERLLGMIADDSPERSFYEMRLAEARAMGRG